MLAITGWYDDVQRGTIQNFTLLTGAGAPAEVRANQWISSGRGTTAAPPPAERKLGRVDFGPGAETDLPALEREWLASVLRKQADAARAGPALRDGHETWREEQEWPLARTRWSGLFPGQRRATLIAGAADGELRREEESGDGAPVRTSYTLRPGRPGALYQQPRLLVADRRPGRLCRGRGAPRRAGLLDRTARPKRWRSPGLSGPKLSRVLQRGRYRLHRQAGRRAPGRLLPAAVRRHGAGPVSETATGSRRPG